MPNSTEIDFQKEGGIIEIEVGRRRCPACGEITYLNRCEKCGAHTIADLHLPEVRAGRRPLPAARAAMPRPCAASGSPSNVKSEYAQAMERLGMKADSVALVKGVKGVISREKTVEPMEKGILRAVQEHLRLQGRHHPVRHDRPAAHPYPPGRGEGVS